MSCQQSSPGATFIHRPLFVWLSMSPHSWVTSACVVLTTPLLGGGLWMVFHCPLVYDSLLLRVWQLGQTAAASPIWIVSKDWGGWKWFRHAADTPNSSPQMGTGAWAERAVAVMRQCEWPRVSSVAQGSLNRASCGIQGLSCYPLGIS